MKTAEFVAYLEKTKKKSDLTVQSYLSDLRQFELFLNTTDPDNFPSDDDSKIDFQLIRLWIMHLSDSNISPRSINRKLSALRSYFRFIEKNDTAFESPMAKIVPPKYTNKKQSYLSQNDIQDLFAEQPDGNDFVQLRNYLILEILYATGIRQAELLRLHEQDIDLDYKTLKIHGKGNKERFVPINAKIIEGLIKYNDLKHRLNIKEGHLMVNQDGCIMSKMQLYSMIHKRLDGYNISKRSAHVFRHTCATHLTENGADIVNVKNLLGHANLSATEIYTHPSIEKLKQEYKKTFGKKFNN